MAGFVGHRSAKLTSEVYIALTARERRASMHIPWLQHVGDGGGVEEGETLAQRAAELASALASPFGSADGRTFPAFTTAAHGRAAAPPVPSDETAYWESLLVRLRAQLLPPAAGTASNPDCGSRAA